MCLEVPLVFGEMHQNKPIGTYNVCCVVEVKYHLAGDTQKLRVPLFYFGLNTVFQINHLAYVHFAQHGTQLARVSGYIYSFSSYNQVVDIKLKHAVHVFLPY